MLPYCRCYMPCRNENVDMQRPENNEAELDDMKKRLKEMEDEAAALREMQAKVEKRNGDPRLAVSR